MNDEPLGATGEFPDGRLTDDDEGELHITVGEHDGRVVVDFGKPIKWTAMRPEEALPFAFALIRAAAMIEARAVVERAERPEEKTA